MQPEWVMNHSRGPTVDGRAPEGPESSSEGPGVYPDVKGHDWIGPAGQPVPGSSDGARVVCVLRGTM